MFKKAIIKIIEFYKLYLSPSLGRHCRFYPSCSEYFKLSLEKQGAAKGTVKGVWRILRCHPFNRGGVDMP